MSKNMLKPLKSLKVLDPNAPFQSPGIMSKRPPNCSTCRWSFKSSGFVPTYVGPDPKIALVFTSPDSEEIVEREALNSARGRAFLRDFIEPYGLTRENLVVTYALSCLAPWDKKTRSRAYPSGTMKANAEGVCSRYNRLHGKNGELVVGGIIGWDPDMFVFSFDPYDCFKTPVYTRLIQRSIDKAVFFSTLGYRPCVLLGEEAVSLQFPWLKTAGGLKNWFSHWQEGKWRSAPDQDFERKREAFIAA